MTSSNFSKHFAATADISQAKAKEVLKALEESIATYMPTLECGDSVKIADVTLKVCAVPERTGEDRLHGTGTWTSPAHNTIRASVSKKMKETVL